MRRHISNCRCFVLIALTAALGAAGATAVTAKAEGITPAPAIGSRLELHPAADSIRHSCCARRPASACRRFPERPASRTELRPYEFLVFEYATGAFIGTQHLLRPDIYERGTPPCPQQPGGEYIYNARNDLWSCLRS